MPTPTKPSIIVSCHCCGDLRLTLEPGGEAFAQPVSDPSGGDVIFSSRDVCGSTSRLEKKLVDRTLKSWGIE